MSKDRDSDDFLGRGLSSVIRRHREREGDEPGGFMAPEPPSEPEPMPAELAGREVVERIARGGIGLVYRVRDQELSRDLAVKVLSKRYADVPEMVERFEAEARICAQLQHPGVVPIHEAGRLADGRPYFTMKVVEGETLVALLAKRDGPDQHRRRYVEVFEKVCQTMAFVHARGFVHGDLKPSNIMVGAFGEVQVMDWGFARNVADAAARRTSDSSAPHILGTPAYMAPEQARGDEAAITSRTDVFGLGAILCELLTGRPPYDGETRSATYLQAAQCWQQDAQQALAGCGGDPALVALATCCLDIDAQRRPKDANEVATAVQRYLAGLEERAQELRLQAVAAEARAAQERRSRRVVTVLGTSLLLAVVVVAGALVWLQDERSSHRAETHRLLAELVERGRSLAERARGADEEALLYWDEAQAALEQARQLVEVRAASGRLRDEVEQLRGSIGEEAAAARREHRLVQWVEQMRPHYTDDREASAVARGYRAGFARFGFAFGEQPEKAVEQIRASPVAGVLCAAIDDWARVARNLREGERGAGSIDWRSLLDIARRADPHPFRDRLRIAFRDSRLEDLLAIAGAAELHTAAPATRNLLAKCLFDLGAREQAVDVLRASVVAHPEDFWSLHDLAVFLRRSTDPPTEEILGLCLAAAAVRPGDAHALCDLAYALAYLEQRWGAAAVVLDRVLAAGAFYSRSWMPELLALTGRSSEALAVARSRAERSPDSAHAFAVLGWTAHLQGLADDAVAAFRKACELQPDSDRLRLNLASALADLRMLDEARGAVRVARRIREEGRSAETWPAADELLAAALERAESGDPEDPAAVPPDPVRATSNFLLGDGARAATELRDWFEAEPERVECVHFVVAMRAAIAAADAAEDVGDALGWQLEAIGFLRAAIERCAAMAGSAEQRHRALTTLRWIQGDAFVRGARWRGQATNEMERMRESMDALARQLLGD